MQHRALLAEHQTRTIFNMQPRQAVIDPVVMITSSLPFSSSSLASAADDDVGILSRLSTSSPIGRIVSVIFSQLVDLLGSASRSAQSHRLDRIDSKATLKRCVFPTHLYPTILSVEGLFYSPTQSASLSSYSLLTLYCFFCGFFLPSHFAFFRLLLAPVSNFCTNPLSILTASQARARVHFSAAAAAALCVAVRRFGRSSDCVSYGLPQLIS